MGRLPRKHTYSTEAPVRPEVWPMYEPRTIPVHIKGLWWYISFSQRKTSTNQLNNDGGSTHLWNVGQLQHDYMALHPRRLYTSSERASHAYVNETLSPRLSFAVVLSRFNPLAPGGERVPTEFRAVGFDPFASRMPVPVAPRPHRQSYGLLRIHAASTFTSVSQSLAKKFQLCERK
jgi:hypothetical protein